MKSGDGSGGGGHIYMGLGLWAHEIHLLLSVCVCCLKVLEGLLGAAVLLGTDWVLRALAHRAVHIYIPFTFYINPVTVSAFVKKPCMTNSTIIDNIFTNESSPIHDTLTDVAEKNENVSRIVRRIVVVPVVS